MECLSSLPACVSLSLFTFHAFSFFFAKFSDLNTLSSIKKKKKNIQREKIDWSWQIMSTRFVNLDLCQPLRLNRYKSNGLAIPSIWSDITFLDVCLYGKLLFFFLMAEDIMADQRNSIKSQSKLTSTGANSN